MTDEELIAFGNKLIKKGRTSIEIYNALVLKSNGKDQLNRVHKQVVKPDAVKKKRSPELVRSLLAANRIKLKSDYSIKSLIRLSLLVIAVGVLVLFLSKKDVNNNAFFGWMTLFQGTVLLVLYWFVKYKKKVDFLIIAMMGYFLIWSIELIVGGFPNDLLEVYNRSEVRTHHLRQLKNVAAARGIAYLFPFMYIGAKFILGYFTVIAYFNHKKYDALSYDIKEELKDF
jgi:acyl-CoA hydrolase